MRTEVVKKEIYTFSELSRESKEVVKQWYLDGQESSIFSDMVNEDLSSFFKSSELKIEYSLSYCQGDGLNIYGILDIIDMFEKLGIEGERQKELLDIFDFDTRMELSKHKDNYGYSLKFKDKKEISDYIYDMCGEELKEDSEQYKIAESFLFSVLDYMEKLDKEYEESGYNYFYEISDEELQEVCDSNGYEFLENGTIY